MLRLTTHLTCMNLSQQGDFNVGYYKKLGLNFGRYIPHSFPVQIQPLIEWIQDAVTATYAGYVQYLRLLGLEKAGRATGNSICSILEDMSTDTALCSIRMVNRLMVNSIWNFILFANLSVSLQQNKSQGDKLDAASPYPI